MSIFIYALVCPESQAIRYIGKTKNLKTRLAVHITKAKGFQTNNHCANWIRSLLNKGMTPGIVSLEELPDGADWQQAESHVIATYRSEGNNLTNSTSDGDGFHDMLPEVIAKGRATWQRTMSDPVRRAAFINSMNESRNRPEVRKKQSDSAKARWSDREKKTALLESMNTPEAIARRSEGSRKAHANPEYAANHSTKRKELWSTPERKAFASARSLKAWSDPQITARRKASMKATVSTPEFKQKMSVINREINSRPEVKAKKSASLKAAHADPVKNAKRLASLASTETRSKMSASAKARFAKPGSKDYLSTPEQRARMSEVATRREESKRRARQK